jgi:hypothetical protein
MRKNLVAGEASRMIAAQTVRYRRVENIPKEQGERIGDHPAPGKTLDV